ncbi:MAG: rod shape-determining protein MreD [Alphaproteobacteria bacterium]|nr:rod shape-determining protein MreD [Alphaproteobacteria bacterium]
MNDNWRESVRLFLLHRIPLLATFILIFLFSVPIHSGELNYFRPMVGVICIYYWGLKYPYMFGYASAFCVGFWSDACSSSPMGINSLSAMLLIFIIDRFGRYLRTAVFGLVWSAFGVITFILLLFKWLVLATYFGRFFSIEEVFICYLTTLMFYPLITAVNVWIQNNFLPQESIDE